MISLEKLCGKGWIREQARCGDRRRYPDRCINKPRSNVTRRVTSRGFAVNTGDLYWQWLGAATIPAFAGFAKGDSQERLETECGDQQPFLEQPCNGFLGLSVRCSTMSK